MNRRFFIKSATAGVATLGFAPSLLLTGCAFSVEGMLNTIISAAMGVLQYVDPSLASGIQKAVTDVQTAITNWKNTGVVADLEQALNALVVIMGDIPLTAVYAPLVGLIVSGVEAVINYFGSAQAKAKLAAIRNGYVGMIPLTPPHAFQTHQGAFKAQFNALAKSLGLTKAVIA